MTKLSIKKFIVTLAIAVCATLGAQAGLDAQPAEAAPSIIVDGQTISSDVVPTIMSGRTMVPVRAIGEMLDASVVWSDATRTVTITKGSNTMYLTAGQYSYTLNGTTQSLDVPITIVNGRTLAPLRVISEGLGAGVLWANNTVYVSATGKILVQVDVGSGYVLNLRSGPGTQYANVGTVQNGAFLEVIDVASNGWYKIKTANGEGAYVSNDYAHLYTGVNSGSPVTPTPDPDPDENQGTPPTSPRAAISASTSTAAPLQSPPLPSIKMAPSALLGKPSSFLPVTAFTAQVEPSTAAQSAPSTQASTKSISTPTSHRSCAINSLQQAPPSS